MTTRKYRLRIGGSGEVYVAGKYSSLVSHSCSHSLTRRLCVHAREREADACKGFFIIVKLARLRPEAM
jgi:hypothetical protein